VLVYVTLFAEFYLVWGVQKVDASDVHGLLKVDIIDVAKVVRYMS